MKLITEIPYGNAADVAIRVEEENAVAEFASDPHGGPISLWFCFRIYTDNHTPPKTKLLWKQFENILWGKNPESVRPVIRYQGSDWTRLGAGKPEALPDGRTDASWVIDSPETLADVAFCYPYGRDNLEELIDDTSGYWKTDVIGVSEKGRPIVRLSNGYGDVGESSRPGFYFVARQHAGETPGSWVLDGLLRRAAELGEKSPLIWAVPMANIDGVEEGDYGKHYYPRDLNRAWGNPEMRQEVRVMAQDMKRWKQRCTPQLCVDFHAPAACDTRGVFLFCSGAGNELYKKSLDKWTDLLQRDLAAKGHAADEFIRRQGESGSSLSQYCFATLGIPGFTLETPYSMIGKKLLTRESYREIGKTVADALFRFWV